MRSRQPYLKRIAPYAALVLFVHVGILPFLIGGFLGSSGEAPDSSEARVVTMRSGSQTKPRVLAERQAKLPKERRQKREAPPPLDGQVVELPPSLQDEAPAEADYLASTNHRVDKETKARNQSTSDLPAGHERTRADPRAKPDRAPAPDIAASNDNPDPGQKATQPERRAMVPHRVAKDRIAFKEDAAQGSVRNQEKQDASTGRDPLEAPGVKDLLDPSKLSLSDHSGGLVPSVGTLARIESAPFADYLENVEEGEGTFLNTKEFKHAGFFNRVKRSVARHWDPNSEMRRRDPTGAMYMNRNRITQVLVHLDAGGNVKNVQVTKSSGLTFLDAEGLRAFKQALRFPNPPPALVDPDSGLISFEFSFAVLRGRSRLF